MKRMKCIKDALLCQVQEQLGNLQAVDAKEMGEVIDMIKDLEEAMYYCTIVEAMEGGGDHYQMEPETHHRDAREGRSPCCRKMYMEAKELHHDTAKKMRELEKYMQELALDIAEMIEGSSPEEKQLLHKNIIALANKIETL